MSLNSNKLVDAPYQRNKNELYHRHSTIAASTEMEGRADALTSSILESENDRLTDELKKKISSLKSVSISIGGEVHGQNKFLSQMDDDVDGAGGLLAKAKSRIRSFRRGSQNYIALYLILFGLFVFLTIWLIIKFQS